MEWRVVDCNLAKQLPDYGEMIWEVECLTVILQRDCQITGCGSVQTLPRRVAGRELVRFSHRLCRQKVVIKGAKFELTNDLTNRLDIP